MAVFTGFSGSFKMEWVAAFGWNWGQLWTGIRKYCQRINKTIAWEYPSPPLTNTGKINAYLKVLRGKAFKKEFGKEVIITSIKVVSNILHTITVGVPDITGSSGVIIDRVLGRTEEIAQKKLEVSSINKSFNDVNAHLAIKDAERLTQYE